jgi:hypothetical protein
MLGRPKDPTIKIEGFQKCPWGAYHLATNAVMLATPLAVDGNQTNSRSNFIRIKQNIIVHFEFVFDFKKTHKLQIEIYDIL